MSSRNSARSARSDTGAARLRRLRAVIGFSQRELAAEFGVAHGAIGSWESGKRSVPGPVQKLVEIYEHELGLAPIVADDAADPRPLERIPANATARVFALGRGFAKATARAAVAGVKPGKRGSGAPAGIVERMQLAVADQVVEKLGELKGLAMKVGQMAGYLEAGVPEAIRERLATLQTRSPPMSPSLVAQVFMEELGHGPRRVFAEWSPQPLAAASIGQVHRARLPDGQEVAVKVQYPRMAQAVEADLKSAGLMESAMALVFRSPSLAPVIAELRARFLEECDYRLEASHQERFRQLWAGRPDVFIPRVFPELSTRRILVTELARGESLAEFAARASQGERNRAGERLFDFAYDSMFRHGVFNGDPHPGNYLFSGDQVAFLDFGCVKRLSPAAVEAFKGLARAMFERDWPALRERTIQAGLVRHPARFDFDSAHRLAVACYEPFLQDGPWRFTREYLERTWRMMWLENRNRFQTALPPDWAFLPRMQWGLYSVLAELGAEVDWRARLLALVYGRADRPPPYGDDELNAILGRPPSRPAEHERRPANRPPVLTQ